MIRELQRQDIDRVSEIWLDSNIKAHDFISPQYWRDNFDGVKALLEQSEVYVYRTEDEIQGFVGLSDDYIAGIFVWSEVRSKGVGKQLLDFVKEKKNQLKLSVYQKNARAVKFYQREQFEIRDENTDENTSEKEYLMMWRRHPN